MTNLDEKIMKELDYATFVKIISNIPSCIFYKDKDLKYRFSSHCWAQLISDDIVGKTDLDIRKDKENAIKAMEADREILRSKKGCNYVIKSDIDGVVSYLELIKEPILGDDGEAIGIVGLINDVTEKVTMQQQILEMSKQLEEQCKELEASNVELKDTVEKVEKLLAASKLFTASMNHELRSPLNGIIGMLQVLMDDNNLDQEEKQNVNNAFQSSQLMLNIVNELLDFAKMERDEFRIKHETFNMRDLLGNVEFVSKNQANAKNLEFNMEVDDSVGDVYVGDEVRIKQIINNFTSNAVKYTDAGSIKLAIGMEDNYLVISCADTGQGMTEEALQYLFDPYVRFNEKKNAKIQGTGLGLSIVKKIIDKMQGSIDVSSEFGVGTTMIAKIPIQAGDNSRLDDNTNGDFVAVNDVREVDFSKLRALCVDDTKANAAVMAVLLKNIGITADKVYSGKEAIDKLKQVKYDIIFMDHQMPEMDGVEAFKIIRSEAGLNKKTPVVMLTGNADESYEKLYTDAGLDGYLVKPAMKNDIIEMIKQACK